MSNDTFSLVSLDDLGAPWKFQDLIRLTEETSYLLLHHPLCKVHKGAQNKIAKLLQRNPDVQILYGDVLVTRRLRKFQERFRKPECAPEWLLSQNYMGDLIAIRRSLLVGLQKHHSNRTFTSLHDFVLFIIGVGIEISYFDEVLAVMNSHKRLHQEVYKADSNAISNYLRAQGQLISINTDSRLYPLINREINKAPLVSIIIPTRGNRRTIRHNEICLAANAIKSIRLRSTYTNYEIIVVHDKSDTVDPDLASEIGWTNAQLLTYSKPFNFSDKCNFGVVHSNGDYLVLFNDDLEVIDHDWIERLLQYFISSDVALVGPRLFFEDGRIQTAGHSLNPGPRNISHGSDPNDEGYFGSNHFPHEVSGISGACAMIPREKYFEVGGMCTSLPNNFNDFDFAFKILSMKWRIIWTPYVRLWHFESQTRNPKVSPSEFQFLKKRWGRYFNRDRFVKN